MQGAVTGASSGSQHGTHSLCMFQLFPEGPGVRRAKSLLPGCVDGPCGVMLRAVTMMLSLQGYEIELARISDDEEEEEEEGRAEVSGGEENGAK